MEMGFLILRLNAWHFCLKSTSTEAKFVLIDYELSVDTTSTELTNFTEFLLHFF